MFKRFAAQESSLPVFPLPTLSRRDPVQFLKDSQFSLIESKRSGSYKVLHSCTLELSEAPSPLYFHYASILYYVSCTSLSPTEQSLP